jgi:polysaccharide pyruvyl transferase WcaK-like protein
LTLRLLAFGGWYGSGNVGDDAILIGVRDLFKRVAPGTEIVALSSDPEQTRSTCRVESIKLQSPRGFLLGGYGGAFEGVDAFIVTGGTPFYDWDHASRFMHMGLARRRLPLACFGVGAKRIESAHGRWLTRLLLSGAVRVSARDRVSRSRLASLAGAVSLTGDSALYMVPAPKRDAEVALEKLGVEAGEDVVVLCPRALSPQNRTHYHDPVTPSLIASIRRGAARLADQLLDEGHRVMLLPMHCAAGDDDRCEMGEIERLMKGTPLTVTEPLPPRVTATLLGSASLVVGFRLHSLILAACQGVPVVGVGYDEKIRGFLEYVGVPDCVVEPDGLVTKARELMRDEGVGTLLRDSCLIMRHRVEEEAAIVAESLGLR